MSIDGVVVAVVLVIVVVVVADYFIKGITNTNESFYANSSSHFTVGRVIVLTEFVVRI